MATFSGVKHRGRFIPAHQLPTRQPAAELVDDFGPADEVPATPVRDALERELTPSSPVVAPEPQQVEEPSPVPGLLT